MNGNNQASDHDVLCAVSDALSGIAVARPPQLELQAVMASGRARQHRRRSYGMTAALAVAAVAAGAAAAAALPSGSHAASTASGSHAASPAASARLAAWTVTRQADGDIHVTINQLSDPAGLQSTLRADHVPASVTFLGQPNPACSPLGTDPSLLGKIIPPSGASRDLTGGVNVGTGVSQDMTIDPSAIPPGTGLQLAFMKDGNVIAGHTALVHAGPQCTGS